MFVASKPRYFWPHWIFNFLADFRALVVETDSASCLGSLPVRHSRSFPKTLCETRNCSLTLILLHKDRQVASPWLAIAFGSFARFEFKRATNSEMPRTPALFPCQATMKFWIYQSRFLYRQQPHSSCCFGEYSHKFKSDIRRGSRSWWWWKLSCGSTNCIAELFLVLFLSHIKLAAHQRASARPPSLHTSSSFHQASGRTMM